MIYFSKPRRHLAECGSTNDVAREWASDSVDSAPSGALVTADFQTQGRGQRGHQWQAQAGQSALMSFVYRLPPAAEVGLLGLMTALAAADGLASLGFSPQIKWPNDLLLNGGKAGGILVEVAAGVAVLGIGINVSQAEFQGAADFAYPPTSLRLATGRKHSVEDVVNAVAHALTHREAALRRDRGAIIDGVRARLAGGTRVCQGDTKGTLISLADSGKAMVRLADGTFAEWTTVN